MVTKVVTDQDVDGVTIIINTENKLACATPASGGSTTVEIEEVTGITNYHDGMGNYVDQPFSIAKGGQQYPITKIGRIKGTNWLVLQADGLLGSVTTPPSTGETITELVTPRVSTPDGSDWIKDGNYYVGYNVTVTLDKPLPDRATFDVELYMNDTLIKTVSVLSDGETTFRVSSGVTSTRILDDGSTPGGEVRIVNVKNAEEGNTTYHIAHTNHAWVGTLGRD